MKESLIILQTIAGGLAIAFGLYSIFYTWAEHPGRSLFLLFGVLLFLSMINRIMRDKKRKKVEKKEMTWEEKYDTGKWMLI